MAIKAMTFDGKSVKRITVDGGLWFEKPAPYTMLDSVYFDGSGMFELPFNITGNDTIRAKFKMLSSSGNLFGYFESSSSDRNFCLYGSSSAYIRYDGTLTRNWNIRSSTEYHEIVFGPTGLNDNDTSKATWSSKTFTGEHPCVGGLPNSTSAKAQWICEYLDVVDKCQLRPAKRNSDDVCGLLDVQNDVFYTGSFIHESAPVSME